MDATGVPVVKKETQGRQGKIDGQPAYTREVKLGCVFTQTTWDKEGYAIRDLDSTTYIGAIETAEDLTLRGRTYAVPFGQDEEPRREPVDLNNLLPHNPVILKQMLVDLTAQLHKTQRLLRQLVASKSGTRSEQLSADQRRLFGQEAGVKQPVAAPQNDDDNPPASASDSSKGMTANRTGADGVRCLVT